MRGYMLVKNSVIATVFAAEVAILDSLEGKGSAHGVLFEFVVLGVVAFVALTAARFVWVSIGRIASSRRGL